MYGNNLYGNIAYSENISNNEEVKFKKIDISKYYPEYLRDIEEIKSLCDVEGSLLGELNYHIKDIEQQLYINIATWGLSLWEKEYGIDTNLNLSYEERREILFSKIMGQGVTTKQLIIDVAKNFSGGDVNVIEDNENNKFIIQFIGIKGIPKNLEGFKNMIESIKPAHLDYELKYTYTVWNDIKKMSWINAKAKNWNELRVYE